MLTPQATSEIPGESIIGRFIVVLKNSFETGN
jgi:hypothetical protein